MIVYTPKQVGEILGSAPETVIRWIREGQLKANNLATGARPRFVIRPADIDDFLVRRQIETSSSKIASRRPRSMRAE